MNGFFGLCNGSNNVYETTFLYCNRLELVVQIDVYWDQNSQSFIDIVITFDVSVKVPLVCFSSANSLKDEQLLIAC